MYFLVFRKVSYLQVYQIVDSVISTSLPDCGQFHIYKSIVKLSMSYLQVCSWVDSGQYHINNSTDVWTVSYLQVYSWVDSVISTNLQMYGHWTVSYQQVYSSVDSVISTSLPLSRQCHIFKSTTEWTVSYMYMLCLFNVHLSQSKKS